MAEKKSFWKTLPGILTGLAAVITAATGLYLALAPETKEPIPPLETRESIPTESTQRVDERLSECDEEVNKAWEMVQAHRGDLTDPIDDVNNFQKVVLEIGCLQHPYTIDLGGHPEIVRFKITVMDQWTHSPSPDETYVYKELDTYLEVGGEIQTMHVKARRIKGSNDDWELGDWQRFD